MNIFLENDNNLDIFIVEIIYNIGIGVDIMNNMLNTIEKQLAELSISFIDFLDTLKENGIISNEEYEKHTVIKKNFLSNISKVEKQ